MNTTPPFILVDGSSYLYRAFHALPPLTNSNGEPTGAIYGVVNMLKRLIKDYTPTYMAVIFDAPGKTFRDDLYSAYKANRPPMPDELRSQIAPLKTIIEALGLPLLSIAGVEADDVIGTLAKQAERAGQTVLISTGDKDMAQLVNNNIHLINTMTQTLLDPEGVKAKFGVAADRIVDYLALVGDSSDNVPGIPKCGPKTAVKWLTEYGSIDCLKQHTDAITGKIGENLRSHLDQLSLAQQLVTINCQLALTQTPASLNTAPANHEILRDLYQRMEFKTWLSELLSNDKVNDAGIPTHYLTILTEVEFKRWQQKIEAADLVAFDTETTSLNYMQAELVGLSFAITPNEAIYIPVAHNYADAPQQLSREWVLAQLRPWLENPAQKKVGQHIKYDKNVLTHYGINLQGIAFDTMLESYTLNSTGSRHDMDSLALKYLGRNTTHFEDIAGKGKKQLTFDQIPLQEATPYAAEDADITLQLHQVLYPKLAAQSGPLQVFETLEVPLITVLSDMECQGVLIDAQHLQHLSDEFARQITILREQAYQLADCEFNLDSPKQLQHILFNQLGLPILKKTPKGQPSTAEAVLQELAADYELPQVIMAYRSYSKLKSTYTDKLPTLINPNTGRVHTSYHQAVASTGRLSSSDPGLQNIPVRYETGQAIRQAFIAPPGYQLLAADYSQIELRIMAHLSQDASLLAAFADNLDIHRATAAEVFDVALEAVTAEQRRNAKAINFGLIYGMSAFGLAKQLHISRHDAQGYIDRYFERYPGIRDYMNNIRQHAHDQGYVETLMGRRLYLPEINDRNAMRRQAAERLAINAPMQGTAADIIKSAMLSLHQALQTSDTSARMIMQVHDELVFEVAKEDASSLKNQVKTHMINAEKLSIPLAVDIGIGDNWQLAH